MDDYIKQSIDARKNAFGASAKIDAGAQKKIDELFAEIEKLGKSCGDVGEFEQKFASSPLNQKYMNLFVEITTGKPADPAASKAAAKATKDATAEAKASAKAAKGQVGKMVAGGAAVGIAESAVDQAIDNVVPTRAAVHQKAYDEVRKVPGVGDAIDISEKASYGIHLGKLFGKHKKKSEGS